MSLDKKIHITLAKIHTKLPPQANGSDHPSSITLADLNSLARFRSGVSLVQMSKGSVSLRCLCFIWTIVMVKRAKRAAKK